MKLELHNTTNETTAPYKYRGALRITALGRLAGILGGYANDRTLLNDLCVDAVKRVQSRLPHNTQAAYNPDSGEVIVHAMESDKEEIRSLLDYELSMRIEHFLDGLAYSYS